MHQMMLNLLEKMAEFQGSYISNGVVNAPGDGYTDEDTTESYIANITDRSKSSN
jgi:hypothetical protein